MIFINIHCYNHPSKSYRSPGLFQNFSTPGGNAYLSISPLQGQEPTHTQTHTKRAARRRKHDTLMPRVCIGVRATARFERICFRCPCGVRCCRLHLIAACVSLVLGQQTWYGFFIMACGRRRVWGRWGITTVRMSGIPGCHCHHDPRPGLKWDRTQ